MTKPARSGQTEEAGKPADQISAERPEDTLLDLWKNADPDIPIYRQAKAEFAKLPSTEN